MYTAYCYYSDILSVLSDLPKEEAKQANAARRYGFLCALLSQNLLTQDRYDVQKHRIKRQVALAFGQFSKEPKEKLLWLLKIWLSYPSGRLLHLMEACMTINVMIGYWDAVWVSRK